MIISLNFSLPTIAGAEAKPPRSAFPSTPCRRKPTEPNLAKLRQILLTDPKVKAEYDRLGSIFAVVGEMIEARQAAGLTQTENREPNGRLSSVVTRLENARHVPTFEMIAR